MVRNMSIEEIIYGRNLILVDVRSEGEFAEGTIPGAVNISLLNNEERAKVGTEYKKVGSDSAKRLGLQLVAPKLTDIIQSYDEIVANRDVVLFCWRGGLRSKIMAQMLDMLDFNVCRIIGGYKAYRRYVNAYLDNILLQKAIVVHGLTGAGKTIVLRKLARKGLPVLDIESLAVHRGSVFGKVGLPSSPSQKDFEAQIVTQLQEAKSRGCFLVECESRRLGKLIVPASVMNTMKKGYRILLYAPLEVRVNRSLEEYAKGLNQKENIDQLLEATKALSRYLGNKKVDFLRQLIRNGRMREAVEFLLAKHYDPLYKYPEQPSSDYDFSVDATDIDLAVDKIYQFVTGLPDYNEKVSGGM